MEITQIYTTTNNFQPKILMQLHLVDNSEISSSKILIEKTVNFKMIKIIDRIMEAKGRDLIKEEKTNMRMKKMKTQIWEWGLIQIRDSNDFKQMIKTICSSKTIKEINI